MNSHNNTTRYCILSDTDKRNSIKHNAQLPLLQLPPEIRFQIWEYVLVGHVFVTGSEYRIEDPEHYCDPDCFEYHGIAVGLLRTCRQIYAETALLLYKRNCFFIYDDHIRDGTSQLPGNAMMRLAHLSLKIEVCLWIDEEERVDVQEYVQAPLTNYHLQLFPGLRRLTVWVHVQVEDHAILKHLYKTFLSELKEELRRYTKEKKEDVDMDFYVYDTGIL